MSEHEPGVATTPEALQQLGALCLGLYIRETPASELYVTACRCAAERTAALLRAYLVEGSVELRQPIAVDDRTLFWTYAQDCVRLSLMGHCLLALSDDELRAIIARP